VRFSSGLLKKNVRLRHFTFHVLYTLFVVYRPKCFLYKTRLTIVSTIRDATRLEITELWREIKGHETKRTQGVCNGIRRRERSSKPTERIKTTAPKNCRWPHRRRMVTQSGRKRMESGSRSPVESRGKAPGGDLGSFPPEAEDIYVKMCHSFKNLHSLPTRLCSIRNGRKINLEAEKW